MTVKRKTLGVVSMFLGACAASAQPPEAGNRVFVQALPGPGAEDRMLSRGGQTFSYISSEFSFGGGIVKNAPYAAEAVTETTQRLADGNRISQKTSSSMYRDSEGRTRREETLGAIGPWASNSEPVKTIFINDPVSKTNLVLDSRNKTAHKMPSPEIRTLPANAPAGMNEVQRKKMAYFETATISAGAPAGVAIQGDVVKHVMIGQAHAAGAVGASTGAMQTFTMALPPPENGDNVKTESLGSQMIEGIRADGTRTTITVPANSIGNDLPIEIVSERWYSPDLQIVVMTKRSDPRMGETLYRITNLSRNEPSRSLFEAPTDYTVTDDSADFRRAMEKAAKEKSKE